MYRWSKMILLILLNLLTGPAEIHILKLINEYFAVPVHTKLLKLLNLKVFVEFAIYINGGL